MLWVCLLFSSVLLASAQTNPPPGSYIRSYINDVPNLPMVMVTVTGAVNIACFTIEESLPGTATPLEISGGGLWLPAQNVIRWGPFFNTVATNVSYRITGQPALYPISGRAWMDGQWYFEPGLTVVPVLPTGSPGVVPSPPPQVAVPIFTPASGASVPTNVTISCATTGAVIYYTLDGTLPTLSATLYTGPLALASASIIRARAFTNGWTPSVDVVAYYGPLAMPAAAQISRSMDTNSLTISFNVKPNSNVACFTLEESLPGLSAVNVSAGGIFLPSNSVVRWGPIFGTNSVVVSYQAVGLPGRYSLQARWSVDGAGGGEAAATNLVVAETATNPIPLPPPQVAAPVFLPASGSNVPVSVTITDATAGAIIYYTLDGSLPTQASTLYAGPIYLAGASVVRAAAFSNGWSPSAACAAYYGPPASTANAQVTRTLNTNSPTTPVVSFLVQAGSNANCVAVTEWLPPGISAYAVSAGGNYLASNNVVLWGPFFGSNITVLCYYTALGPPGTYPLRASWSVDGISAEEPSAPNLLIAAGASGGFIPAPPPQEPTPRITPPSASGLPVTVSISSSDPQAQLYFTTDGTLPTQNSSPYYSPLTFTTQTALRARAFRAGYQPSTAALGEYVSRPTSNTVALARSTSGSGGFLPAVTLTATPQGAVNCYSVMESFTPGLTPSGLSNDAFVDPFLSVIRWGPYLDNQPRTFTYRLSGPSGLYPLTGEGSFDGYPVGVTGATNVQINANYAGQQVTNLGACANQHLTYNVDIDPSPGVITVTQATGVVDWGDGTTNTITQPIMSFQKTYGTNGTFSIIVLVDWAGYTSDGAFSHHASWTDSVQVVTACVPPTIVTQPSDQVALAGATAQFTVSASSPVPMSYQWYFNQSARVVSSGTFDTLLLPQVSTQAMGNYSVVVANGFGSVTSRLASLSVYLPRVTGAARNANGSVTLSFEGLPNATTRVWATTNLALPEAWQPIFTNTTTTTNGAWQFTDTNASAFQSRFYRFSTP